MEKTLSLLLRTEREEEVYALCKIELSSEKENYLDTRRESLVTNFQAKSNVFECEYNLR